MQQTVFSVSQVNEYLRSLMEEDSILANIAVRGEISNYKLYPSGHHYFTLKDDGGAIKAVMFKGNAFRLRFRPENGMKVIALGRVSVYSRDGVYQIICSALLVDGVGDLAAAFEQMKARLEEQGLFDPAHKKPIPFCPEVIGIVTSEAGAAIHDMLRIIGKRFPLSAVRLFPVRVQGEGAGAEIAKAIDYANQFRLADVLIVGRGGGSMEDLWAFNEETVANAIYRSEIPVISAVGHEPDVTISDYVADLRAATPSNAAEMVVPDQEALRQTLDAFCASIGSGLSRQLQSARRQLEVLKGAQVLRSPRTVIERRREGLAALSERLASGYQKTVHMRRQAFISQAAKLDALSPLKVLTRGYALVQKADGTAVRSVLQANSGDILKIHVSDGMFHAVVAEEEGNQYES